MSEYKPEPIPEPDYADMSVDLQSVLDSCEPSPSIDDFIRAVVKRAYHAESRVQKLEGERRRWQSASQKLNGEVESLRERLERAEETVEMVRNWAKAYPLEVFPEPDLKMAGELLGAGGISLASISAFNCRHVITRLIAECDAVLAEIPQVETCDCFKPECRICGGPHGERT